MMFSRWNLLIFSLLMLLSWPVFAAAVDSPEQTVEQVTNQLLRKLRTAEDRLRGNPDEVRALIDNALAPHVDFPRMSRLVLGKHWRKASSQQKKDFIREFRGLLIRFYSGALASWLLDKSIPEDIDMTFLPTQTPDEKRATVRTRVQSSGYSPVAINYSLYRHGDNAWKVYDVSVGGISVIMNYRTSFADQIRTRGVDGLIQQMAEKNAQT
jgi:phospholipid transport system substrate-binding protein